MARKKLKQIRRPDVPERDHIARWVNHQRVIRDPETNEIKGVYPEAFELRTHMNEKSLSTRWLEVLAATINEQFKEAVKAFRIKLPVTPASAVARLNVGRVLTAGKDRARSLRVRDRSSLQNPGYSEIYNLPQDNADTELLAILATDCCLEVRGVAEIENTSAASNAA